MRHAKLTRIKDAYPNGFTGNGVFTDLQKLDVPWKNENLATSLDVLYYSRSGDKNAAKIVRERMENEQPLTTVSRDIIALSLLIMYSHSWQKLYAILSAEYNPIENYRMVESETSTHTVESETTDTGTDTISDTGTKTTTDTGTDSIANTGTISNSGNNSASNAVYGFNSSEAVNSDETSGTNSDTETRNLSQQETRNLSEQETRNLSQQETRNLAGTNSETGENERELTRSGNIGVTTSQQMIVSEIELWKWQFFNQVFEDIDRILTLSVY